MIFKPGKFQLKITYNEALDLHEVRRKTTDDFIFVYLSNDVSDFELELTWLKDHPQPYNLGECEFHLAFCVSNARLILRIFGNKPLNYTGDGYFIQR